MPAGMIVMRSAVTVLGVLAAIAATAQVTLVRAGEATAVVVLAGQPTATARYAAAELVTHVEMAAGVRLAVVSESGAMTGAAATMHSRVYIGCTEAGRHEGIHCEELPREAFLLRSVGNDLFIAGREDDSDPMDPSNPLVGALFGVYEFLESVMGVRWLWPGELGVFVPRTDTIELSAIHRLEAPALLYRELRWGTTAALLRGRDIDPEDARLGFSPDGARAYAEALSVLLRRHRMGGRDIKPPTGHAFQGWWERHGAEHPEWFMMSRDGVRGHPEPDYPFVDLCVTNEELQDFIVEQWDGESVLRLGPVDRPGRCICDECRAWDGPQPDPIPWFAMGVYATDRRAQDAFAGATSDRYARFWKVIQEKARARNPHALVSGSFIYENEFPAPVTGIQLNRNIYAEFVQWQDPHLRWFPMPAEAYEWLKEQWLGWKRTGLRMGYRPNYLHDGYTMPHFDTRQSGDFFRFAFEHGMEGAHFDSLTGQWAVHGPRLYMHLRLLAKPDLEVDAIRQEYFSAFGPAAGTIEQYFDYWEDYAVDNVLHFIELFQTPFVGWRYRAYPLKVHEAFPPAVFEPAAALLAQASAEARTGPLPEFAERVRFLEAGLEHARKTAALAALFGGHARPPAERLEETRQALEELVQFRKDHQHLFFSDLQWVSSYWERPRWDLDDLIAMEKGGP